MITTGGDPSLLRRVNQAAVLRALYAADALTLTELVKATAVARNTVENALAGLVEQQWVAEVAPAAEGPRQVGRPAKRYRFRGEAGCVLGLDIGVHKILAIVADLRGNVLALHRTAVGPAHSPVERIAAARSLARRTLRSAAQGVTDVRATGVATTGVVSATGTVTVSGRMPEWAGTDLAAAFAKTFGVPVAVGNDSSLAAVGEQWRGVASGHQDVIYIHVGHRIAAGVLLNGRLRAGHHGAAGEIGVLRGSGWHTAPGRLLAHGDSAEALFEAVRAGDDRAERTLAGFTGDLAQGVAAMVLTVDPELVVVGGGLSRAGELLLAPLRSRLAELCLFPVEVAASTLGDEAAALGGVRLALDAVERELFRLPGTT
ncbi:ROK family protein [Streptomyces sp. CMB-StM0423]|uniref:ROK family protein n=1 Tax=Streptomyces sp. CMB-StM0423 TaxID=2059884 RepID=UPI000C70C822|nr:ROK family protein [Streptomyces sp. CMB-StM0423]AUH44406.1 ROK family transcriptional regulator [Streptomyces sp. CMB-StM0423]